MRCCYKQSVEHNTVLLDVTDMVRICGFPFSIAYNMKKFFGFEKTNDLHTVHSIQSQKARPNSSLSQPASHFEKDSFFLSTIVI